jgi:hypothetical protein
MAGHNLTKNETFLSKWYAKRGRVDISLAGWVTFVSPKTVEDI